MKVTPCKIADVLLIEPRVFRDERGFFHESYHQPRFAEAGIDCQFVQDNHACSKKNTLRGLHYQSESGQAKLVRVSRGAIWDVVVDIRPESPSFGQWVATELSDENFRMLYIPLGFAHAYLALSDHAEVQYKCSNIYMPETEKGIAYNDPDIGIPWPVSEPILSDRDRNNLRLRDVFPHMFPSPEGKHS